MESKTYVFNPESGTSGTGSNGILAMLPALMQRQGVDPGLIAQKRRSKAQGSIACVECRTQV